MLVVNPLGNILKTHITANIENTKAVKTVVSEQFDKLTVTLAELLVRSLSLSKCRFPLRSKDTEFPTYREVL